MLQNINKQKLYWIFQTTGWGSFALFYTFIASYFYHYHWKILAGYLFSAIIGLLLSHAYRKIIKKRNWLKESFWNLTKRMFIASFVLAILWMAITVPVNKTLFYVDIGPEFKPEMLFVLGFYMFIMMFGWSLIYFAFNFFYNYKASEIEKLRLDSVVKEAELETLKSQVNPHFIFNCLNNIRSLIVEDAGKAREMITHLSGLLRYSIQFNNQEKVTLEDELEVVRNYLQLESIQYEDRLRYQLDIGPETLEYKIPPMVVQLLVENAIKHGISNLPTGGEVEIKSFLENNSLIIEVINSGTLKTEVVGTGIGLKNASERLKLLFGKLSDLSIENLPGNKVSAKFSIPLN